MSIWSYAKIGYISLFLFTIPLFSAEVEKETVDSDCEELCEDETGIPDLRQQSVTLLTKKLVESAKTKDEAITLCEEFMKRSAKHKDARRLFKNCARDALAAWAKQIGKPKPRLTTFDYSDSESDTE